MVKKFGVPWSDGNSSFLRAARAGNLEKVLDYLKGSIDINTSNANGLNALHLASKEGHVNVVTELLSRGANVDAATKKGNTALHIASLAGQEEIVKILVQNGAKVNAQASTGGFTPLYMGAQENHVDVVKYLLLNGASQTLTTDDGFTPLAVALQQGHDKVVTVLLENDTRGRVRLPALHIAAKKDDVKSAALLLNSEHSVDGQSKSGFTPLHIASHYGNINVGTLLIENGADVSFKARNQIQPMHVASKWGKTNMVTLLLDAGADMESHTRDGLTPLHCAARSGHDQVVDLLLERSADVASKTKNKLSPLHMAAQGDHADCARILLIHKAPIDDVTVDYLTPLHVAAHCGNVKTAKLLLDRKCEANARALNGFTPLHIACKKNRIKVIELLLKYGASIEATTETGLTPLHVAAFMGHMNIVIYLIQNGANPDTPNMRGETALHHAARANQTDILRVLLRNNATVDARAREGQTALHIAARLGNVDNVLLLLQHGATVDATTKDHYTPLHIAAKEGHEETAAVLLEHGANHALITKKGFTPLHIAAKFGNIKVARLLLQKEANPNAEGKNGLCPLHVATHYNHVQVALLLLEHRASPHAAAKSGYTPLHIAAKKNQMDIATTLLEFGAQANAGCKNGFTPLHLAALEGHTDMVSLLLEHGADVNCTAKNQLTPMHLAAQEDRVPVAEILVKHQAAIDPQTKAGYTPLHTACHFGQINMIRFLLEHGANVNSTTKLGYTPLHQAAQQGHVLVINLLLKHGASPNALAAGNKTPLSIAQQLGYISVVEILKNITEVQGTSYAQDDKYDMVSPETMTDALLTDSEDEADDDTHTMGDQSFNYITTHDLQDGSMSPIKTDERDFSFLERYSMSRSMSDRQEGRYRSSAPPDDVQIQRLDASQQYDAALEYDRQPYSTMDSVFDREPAQEEFLQAASAPSQQLATRAHEERNTSMYGSYSGVSFASSFDPDNVAVDRQPIYSGFLVSFLVDARGGAMRGCRHSGVRIIIPPGKASMPTRVTCKLVRREKLMFPPPLMEGEALASRVLEMGPVGTRFLGPVIIEVPHFASLRGREREIVVVRCDDGETWKEHPIEATEEVIAGALGGSFEDLESAEDLYKKRITRIVTTDFPQCFAIVTRVRQESTHIGPEGGVISSTVVPQVQALFSQGALTKKIKVGLQAQPVPSELVTKLLGNRVAVSPIVTVEPRRRKFHKPIELTIPVPRAAQKGMLNQYGGGGNAEVAPSLRLLCSITGGTSAAQWEDITHTTPLRFVNDCVSFTTTVSARYWLVDCQQTSEAARLATELYRDAIAVPFMSKFVVFAKRRDSVESRLRVFCMTDDKMDKTLESQEHFHEVARSKDVEVLEGKAQYVEMGGNIVPVTKSGDQLYINFHAFRENRLPFTVRVRDSNQDHTGRIAFMNEAKSARSEQAQHPICTLNLTLPELIGEEHEVGLKDAEELRRKYELMKSGVPGDGEQRFIRAELQLTDIADALQGDWPLLAAQLGITEQEVYTIQTEHTYVCEQAIVMLHMWLQKDPHRATGNELERALKRLGREDVIRKCLHGLDVVTDDEEKRIARSQLEASEYDGSDATRSTGAGSFRNADVHLGHSLDVRYDEQDIVKDESAAEESSRDRGSIVDRQLTPTKEGSPATEEALSPTQAPAGQTSVEDLIRSLEGEQLECMDDRMSEGSLEEGERFLITDQKDTSMEQQEELIQRTTSLLQSASFEETTQSGFEREDQSQQQQQEEFQPQDQDISYGGEGYDEDEGDVERPRGGEEVGEQSYEADEQFDLEGDARDGAMDRDRLAAYTETCVVTETSHVMTSSGDAGEGVEQVRLTSDSASPFMASPQAVPEPVRESPFYPTTAVTEESVYETQKAMSGTDIDDLGVAGGEDNRVITDHGSGEEEEDEGVWVDVESSSFTEDESEETRSDGTVVRRTTRVIKHFQRRLDVSATITSERTETETRTRPVGTEIVQEVLELPPGVSSLQQEGIETKTKAEDYREDFEDGTWLKKTVRYVCAKRVSAVSCPMESDRVLTTDVDDIESDFKQTQYTDLETQESHERPKSVSDTTVTPSNETDNIDSDEKYEQNITTTSEQVTVTEVTKTAHEINEILDDDESRGIDIDLTKQGTVDTKETVPGQDHRQVSEEQDDTTFVMAELAVCFPDTDETVQETMHEPEYGQISEFGQEQDATFVKEEVTDLASPSGMGEIAVDQGIHKQVLETTAHLAHEIPAGTDIYDQEPLDDEIEKRVVSHYSEYETQITDSGDTEHAEHVDYRDSEFKIEAHDETITMIKKEETCVTSEQTQREMYEREDEVARYDHEGYHETDVKEGDDMEEGSVTPVNIEDINVVSEQTEQSAETWEQVEHDTVASVQRADDEPVSPSYGEETEQEFDETVIPSYDEETKQEFDKPVSPSYGGECKQEFGEGVTHSYDEEPEQEYGKTVSPSYNEDNKQEFDETVTPPYGRETEQEFNETVSPSYGEERKQEFDEGVTPSYGEESKPEFDEGVTPSHGEESKQEFGEGVTSSYDEEPKQEYGETVGPSYGEEDKQEFDEAVSPSYGEESKQEFGEGVTPSYDEEPKQEYGETVGPSYGEEVKQEFDEAVSLSYGEESKQEFGEGDTPAYDEEPKQEYGETVGPSYGEEDKQQFDEAVSPSYGEERKQEFNEGVTSPYGRETEQEFDEIVSPSYGEERKQELDEAVISTYGEERKHEFDEAVTPSYEEETQQDFDEGVGPSYDEERKHEFEEEVRPSYGEEIKQEFDEAVTPSFGEDTKQEVGEVGEERKQELDEAVASPYAEERKREFKEEVTPSYDEETKQDFDEDVTPSFDEEPKQEYGETHGPSYGEETKREFDEDVTPSYGRETEQEFDETVSPSYSEERKQELNDGVKPSYEEETIQEFDKGVPPSYDDRKHEFEEEVTPSYGEETKEEFDEAVTPSYEEDTKQEVGEAGEESKQKLDEAVTPPYGEERKLEFGGEVTPSYDEETKQEFDEDVSPSYVEESKQEFGEGVTPSYGEESKQEYGETVGSYGEEDKQELDEGVTPSYDEETKQEFDEAVPPTYCEDMKQEIDEGVTPSYGEDTKQKVGGAGEESKQELDEAVTPPYGEERKHEFEWEVTPSYGEETKEFGEDVSPSYVEESKQEFDEAVTPSYEKGIKPEYDEAVAPSYGEETNQEFDGVAPSYDEERKHEVEEEVTPSYDEEDKQEFDRSVAPSYHEERKHDLEEEVTPSYGEETKQELDDAVPTSYGEETKQEFDDAVTPLYGEDMKQEVDNRVSHSYGKDMKQAFDEGVTPSYAEEDKQEFDEGVTPSYGEEMKQEVDDRVSHSYREEIKQDDGESVTKEDIGTDLDKDNRHVTNIEAEDVLVEESVEHPDGARCIFEDSMYVVPQHDTSTMSMTEAVRSELPVEEDVEEFEEVLEDGTIVKRRITKTRQTIVTSYSSEWTETQGTSFVPAGEAGFQEHDVEQQEEYPFVLAGEVGSQEHDVEQQEEYLTDGTKVIRVVTQTRTVVTDGDLKKEPLSFETIKQTGISKETREEALENMCTEGEINDFETSVDAEHSAMKDKSPLRDSGMESSIVQDEFDKSVEQGEDGFVLVEDHDIVEQMKEADEHHPAPHDEVSPDSSADVTPSPRDQDKSIIDELQDQKQMEEVIEKTETNTVESVDVSYPEDEDKSSDDDGFVHIESSVPGDEMPTFGTGESFKDERIMPEAARVVEYSRDDVDYLATTIEQEKGSELKDSEDEKVISSIETKYQSTDFGTEKVGDVISSDSYSETETDDLSPDNMPCTGRLTDADAHVYDEGKAETADSLMISSHSEKGTEETPCAVLAPEIVSEAETGVEPEESVHESISSEHDIEAEKSGEAGTVETGDQMIASVYDEKITDEPVHEISATQEEVSTKPEVSFKPGSDEDYDEDVVGRGEMSPDKKTFDDTYADESQEATGFDIETHEHGFVETEERKHVIEPDLDETQDVDSASQIIEDEGTEYQEQFVGVKTEDESAISPYAKSKYIDEVERTGDVNAGISTHGDVYDKSTDKVETVTDLGEEKPEKVDGETEDNTSIQMYAQSEDRVEEQEESYISENIIGSEEMQEQDRSIHEPNSFEHDASEDEKSGISIVERAAAEDYADEIEKVTSVELEELSEQLETSDVCIEYPNVCGEEGVDEDFERTTALKTEPSNYVDFESGEETVQILPSAVDEPVKETIEELARWESQGDDEDRKEKSFVGSAQVEEHPERIEQPFDTDTEKVFQHEEVEIEENAQVMPVHTIESPDSIKEHVKSPTEEITPLTDAYDVDEGDKFKEFTEGKTYAGEYIDIAQSTTTVYAESENNHVSMSVPDEEITQEPQAVETTIIEDEVIMEKSEHIQEPVPSEVDSYENTEDMSEISMVEKSHGGENTDERTTDVGDLPLDPCVSETLADITEITTEEISVSKVRFDSFDVVQEDTLMDDDDEFEREPQKVGYQDTDHEYKTETEEVSHKEFEENIFIEYQEKEQESEDEARVDSAERDELEQNFAAETKEEISFKEQDENDAEFVKHVSHAVETVDIDSSDKGDVEEIEGVPLASVDNVPDRYEQLDQAQIYDKEQEDISDETMFRDEQVYVEDQDEDEPYEIIVHEDSDRSAMASVTQPERALGAETPVDDIQVVEGFTEQEFQTVPVSEDTHDRNIYLEENEIQIESEKEYIDEQKESSPQEGETFIGGIIREDGELSAKQDALIVESESSTDLPDQEHTDKPDTEQVELFECSDEDTHEAVNESTPVEVISVREKHPQSVECENDIKVDEETFDHESEQMLDAQEVYKQDVGLEYESDKLSPTEKPDEILFEEKSTEFEVCVGSSVDLIPDDHEEDTDVLSDKVMSGVSDNALDISLEKVSIDDEQNKMSMYDAEEGTPIDEIDINTKFNSDTMAGEEQVTVIEDERPLSPVTRLEHREDMHEEVTPEERTTEDIDQDISVDDVVAYENVDVEQSKDQVLVDESGVLEGDMESIDDADTLIERTDMIDDTTEQAKDIADDSQQVSEEPEQFADQHVKLLTYEEGGMTFEYSAVDESEVDATKTDVGTPVDDTRAIYQVDTTDDGTAVDFDACKQFDTQDVEPETETTEYQETLDDGTVVTRRVTKITTKQIFTETDTEVMQPDVCGDDDVQTVEHFEETLPDGTIVTRKIVRSTRVITSQYQENEYDAEEHDDETPEQHLDERFNTASSPIEKETFAMEADAANVEDQYLSEEDILLKESDRPDEASSSPVDTEVLHVDDSQLVTMGEDYSELTQNEDDRTHVFTRRIEGEPETEVEIVQDVMPDGTIVITKITRTKTRETVIKRIVTELSPDESAALDYDGPMTSEVVHYTSPDVETNEVEEVLPEGTVVKKKLTRTRETKITEYRTEGVETYPGEAHGLPKTVEDSPGPEMSENPFDMSTDIDAVMAQSPVETECIPGQLEAAEGAQDLFDEALYLANQEHLSDLSPDKVLPDNTDTLQQQQRMESLPVESGIAADNLDYTGASTSSAPQGSDDPDETIEKAQLSEALQSYKASEPPVEHGLDAFSIDQEAPEEERTEVEEVLPDGTIVKRKILNTTQTSTVYYTTKEDIESVPAVGSSSVGPDGPDKPYESIEKDELSDALQSHQAFEPPLGHGMEAFSIYQDSPEVESTEFEEILPDGTVVKRKVIKTKQTRTVHYTTTEDSESVPAEGSSSLAPQMPDQPDGTIEKDELSGTLQSHRASDPTVEHGMEAFSIDQDAPEVETTEFEEVLPDGTVVKRKVIKTKQTRTVHYTTTEDSESVPAEGSSSLAPQDPDENVDKAELSDAFQSHQAFEPPLEHGMEAFSIYQDSPEVESTEFEEVLPDGTVVKRKIIKTKQTRIVHYTTTEDSESVPAERNSSLAPRGPDENVEKAEPNDTLQSHQASEPPLEHWMEAFSIDQGSPEVETTEFEEVLPDGTVVKRKIIKTIQTRIVHYTTTEDSESVPAEGSPSLSPQESFEPDQTIDKAELSDALQSHKASEPPVEHGVDAFTIDQDAPEVETTEFEEVLPDGTIVKRKVIKTKQTRTVHYTTTEPDETIEKYELRDALQAHRASEPTVEHGMEAFSIDQDAPEVETTEVEEVLPDGTIVKRKVVKTKTRTVHYTTTEAVESEMENESNLNEKPVVETSVVQEVLRNGTMVSESPGFIDSDLKTVTEQEITCGRGTEVYQQVLPDGSIVTRRISKNEIGEFGISDGNLSQLSTTGFSVDEQQSVSSGNISTPETIETEEVLPDGTIVKRKITKTIRTENVAHIEVQQLYDDALQTADAMVERNITEQQSAQAGQISEYVYVDTIQSAEESNKQFLTDVDQIEFHDAVEQIEHADSKATGVEKQHSFVSESGISDTYEPHGQNEIREDEIQQELVQREKTQMKQDFTLTEMEYPDGSEQESSPEQKAFEDVSTPGDAYADLPVDLDSVSKPDAVNEDLIEASVLADSKQSPQFKFENVQEPELMTYLSPDGTKASSNGGSVSPTPQYVEVEKLQPDGTVVKRRILSQRVKKFVTRKIRRVGPDGDIIEDVFTEEVPESDLLSQSSRSSSYQSSLSDARELTSPLPMSPVEIGSPYESDTERSSVRVYTDTIEGEPEVETDVQEFEDTLPDGTIVKRKVIRKRHRQTIVKRLVMEGPETDLPTTEEQAQLMLSHSDAFEHDMKYSDYRETKPTSDTSVQEYEELLEDGTVVKKKVTTTKQLQLRTERTVLQASSPPELMNGDSKSSAVHEDPGTAYITQHQQRAPRGFVKVQENVMAENVAGVELPPSRDRDAVTEDDVIPDLKDEAQTLKRFSGDFDDVLSKSDDFERSVFDMVEDESEKLAEDLHQEEVVDEESIDDVPDASGFAHVIVDELERENIMDENDDLVDDESEILPQDQYDTDIAVHKQIIHTQSTVAVCGSDIASDLGSEDVENDRPLSPSEFTLDPDTETETQGRLGSDTSQQILIEQSIAATQQIVTIDDRPPSPSFLTLATEEDTSSSKSFTPAEFDINVNSDNVSDNAGTKEYIRSGGFEDTEHDNELSKTTRRQLSSSYENIYVGVKAPLEDVDATMQESITDIDVGDRFDTKHVDDEFGRASSFENLYDDETSNKEAADIEEKDIDEQDQIHDSDPERPEKGADSDAQLETAEGAFQIAEGDDMETTRLVLRKQIHKRTVMRDGKEETVVTEDTHVEQDDSAPEELQQSVQTLIDQFMVNTENMGKDEGQQQLQLQ